MSVLCRLGWHRPMPMARWNGGYYFTSCGRCGRDLVRSAFEGWHAVPEGYRVVWSPTAPERALNAQQEHAHREQPATPELPVAAPVAEETEPAPGPEAEVARPIEQPPDAQAPLPAEHPTPPAIPAAEEGSLPISEVLRLLRAHEQRMAEVAAAGAKQAAAEPLELEETDAEWTEEAPEDSTAERPRQTPADPFDDFMADSADAEFWVGANAKAAEIETVAEAAEDAPDTGPSEPELPLGETMLEEPQATAEAVPSPAQEGMVWPSAAPSQDHMPLLAMDTPAGERKWIGPAVAAALVLAALVAVIVLQSQRTEPAGRGPPAGSDVSRAASGPRTKPSSAFVTARLVKCRASPADRARLMRVLARGTPVEVLAREPGWASVTYRGRQCWVVDRYLAEQRPL